MEDWQNTNSRRTKDSLQFCKTTHGIRRKDTRRSKWDKTRISKKQMANSDSERKQERIITLA
jgi:hypothetical protein